DARWCRTQHAVELNSIRHDVSARDGCYPDKYSSTVRRGGARNAREYRTCRPPGITRALNSWHCSNRLARRSSSPPGPMKMGSMVGAATRTETARSNLKLSDAAVGQHLVSGVDGDRGRSDVVFSERRHE